MEQKIKELKVKAFDIRDQLDATELQAEYLRKEYNKILTEMKQIRDIMERDKTKKMDK